MVGFNVWRTMYIATTTMTTTILYYFLATLLAGRQAGWLVGWLAGVSDPLLAGAGIVNSLRNGVV